MTAGNLILAGASSTDTRYWDAINWQSVEASVRRLQMRIAKAVQKGRHKAKVLQWLLTHSFQAKLLAIKQVTQSRGAKTAGVDGKICRTSKQKVQLARALQRRGYQAQPLRRVYIPKKNSTTERRPLSIPTISDRAMQALYLLALEPIAELNADPNSYGFRPRRCAADAIEQCFKALGKRGSASYILEGDIRQCLTGWISSGSRLMSQWTRKYLSNGWQQDTWIKTHFIPR